MKKTYINPAMEIYSIDAQQQLLAGSTIPVDGTIESATGAESNEFDDLGLFNEESLFGF